MSVVNMDLRINCALFSFVFALLATGTKDLKPECQAWQNVTDVVKRLDRLNVTCNIYDNPCSGFNCSGVLNYEGSNENIRFGVYFIPCSDPLKFEVIIDLPTYPSFNLTMNISKDQVINKTIPIPGLTRTYDKYSIEGKLVVVLVSSQSASGMPHITAEMNVTLKVTRPIEDMRSFVLIPNVTFPYPSCNPQTPPNLLPESSSMASSVTPEFTGDSCSSFSLESPCKRNNTMCRSDGKCVCMPGYIWSKDAGQCVGYHDHKAAGPDVWIIIAATISAVVIVAGILIMVVYKYRRHRERYGQHALLLNNDNDDDTELDDPDPPMLTG